MAAVHTHSSLLVLTIIAVIGVAGALACHGVTFEIVNETSDTIEIELSGRRYLVEQGESFNLSVLEESSTSVLTVRDTEGGLIDHLFFTWAQLEEMEFRYTIR